MRKRLKTGIFLFAISLLMPIFMASAAPNTLKENDFRGVWVATVVNIDYPSKPTTDPEILKSEALEILDNAQKTGLNAVILQVRPAADAFYKSKYFPWSKYLTGSQGLMPQGNFDPLEFWVSEAHKRGMELHAWINPYRVTKKTSAESSHDFNSLDPAHPARVNPGWVVQYPDGNLYFNPGIPEVRSLIVDGVREIVENYDVDGIHFDDYFYPGKDFNDKAAFEKYKTGNESIDDWRRANVNTLIDDVSKAVKEAGGNVRFGISPFGIWANKGANSLGSDTRGKQAYYDYYADTRKWVKEKMLDYIAPQIYWNIGYSLADYSKLLSWWNDTVSGTGVDLYIGQAAYRAGNSDPSSAWYGVSEIQKQLQLNEKTPEVKGSIFFSYKSFAKNPSLSAVIKAVFEGRDGIVPEIPVTVSRPSEDIKTSYSQFYLNGSSDPDKPLFLNGIPVETRSVQGHFGLLVPLEMGENIFTLSQEASYVTRVIYRKAASNTPEKMTTVGIPLSSTFPQQPEYRVAGEKITLSCKAPAGSTVTVKLGGKSYTMKPSTTVSNGSGIYAATYTYVYTVPAYKGTPRVVNLGAPVYTMKYKKTVKTTTAPAKIGAIMNNAPFYARVAKGTIDTYNTPSAVNGAAYELYEGMTGRVTGMTGNYVRLSLGQWVKKDSVKTYISGKQINPLIKKAVYNTGDRWDKIKLDISSPTTATAWFDGTSLKLNISAALPAALPALPEEALFSSAVVSKAGSSVQYTFKLKDNRSIEGYYIEKTAAGIVLNIKRQITVSEGSEPLTGITIMIDPGHGGNEFGAIGPLGKNYAEKDINLNISLKLKAELERLGAKVLATRTTDKALSLEDRLSASRKARPDMFVSIHANSMADNVDISKTKGFSVFYREVLAKPIAEGIFNNVIYDLDRFRQGIHNKNFYVIRGTWAPSILIESGFVPNPHEFEWLTDENEQARLAESISEAIVKYFSE